MNIKQKTKKNGQTVYYASLYLGVDSITGKKSVLPSLPEQRKRCN
ncbi:hypothetical protein [Streptococcus suis]|uniref:Integrase n=1 Tax=Streptococcus suis TaxID=1307 RepID=A0A123TKQ1_STRSU|nr:hypothetical protein [Streptococcus suis]CYV39722.1 Integrase [Streptococcus suis]CYV78224.1 Integrase [Streptococcus suis]